MSADVEDGVVVAHGDLGERLGGSELLLDDGVIEEVDAGFVFEVLVGREIGR